MQAPFEQLHSELGMRKNKILLSDPIYAIDELRIFFDFLDFLDTKPILKALLQELNQNKPDFRTELAKMQKSNRIRWPKTETQKVKLCLTFLEHCIQSQTAQEHLNVAYSVGFCGAARESSTFYLNQFFVPISDYLSRISYSNVGKYLQLKPDYLIRLDNPG
jgi:hypothetical protein